MIKGLGENLRERLLTTIAALHSPASIAPRIDLFSPRPMQIPSPANFVLTTCYASNRLGVSDVFLRQDAVSQRMRVIALQHRDSPLQDDRAVIQLFIYEMHRASGHFDTVVEGLLLRIQTRKRR